MANEYLTTKELLRAVPLPLQTQTYKPVAHGLLMDLTLEGIHKAGFQLTRETYSWGSGGEVAHAQYAIGNVADKEMQLQIAWQNSYNKQLRLTFATGAKVLVCTNGMISFRAMSTFKKKHTGEIQTITPQRIAQYIEQAAEVFTTLQQDRDRMKEIEISKTITAELIGRMYIEQDFLESTQLNIIKRELSKPTFDYNASGSLWELYNYTTFAIGGIRPARWMEDHIAAHKFFVEAADALAGAKSYDYVPANVIIEDKRQLKLFDEL